MDEEIIQPELEEKDLAGKGRVRTRRGIRFWVVRAVLFVIALGMVPVILTVFYYPSFVHPISTLMIKDLAALRGYDRQWVAIDDVAPVLSHSVIMSEDGQFCRHMGVDLGELRVVIDDALAGEATRGASTITMQTVKNLYLWHRPLSTLRKVIELPYAVYLDLVLPKRRILEIYLNIAEWAPGVYGIEAGAQHHFGVAAAKLTARQAALMAVTLPNPAERNPAKPSAGLKRLASTIQRRAAQAGDYVGCVD